MIRSTLGILSLLLAVPALSQETGSPEPGRKEVTITRTWTDDEGRERKVTIIKEAEDTPGNAEWLGSDDVQAPESAMESQESRLYRDRDEQPFQWKRIPEELRYNMEDLGDQLEDHWPQIQQDLEAGMNQMFFFNGRPLDRQPFLGVVTTSGDRGAVITEVVAGSAAESAGIQAGDEIVALNGRTVRSSGDVVRAVNRHKPGETVSLRLRQGTRERTLDVTLGNREDAGVGPAEHMDLWGEDHPRKWVCSPQARLGVTLDDADDGPVIREVSDNTAAERAGLRAGDRLVSLGGEDVGSADDVVRVVRSHKPGETIDITFVRDGDRQSVAATLGQSENVLFCPPGCCEKGSRQNREKVGTVETAPADAGTATLELKDLRIYPNPTRDRVQVAIKAVSDAPITVRLLDASGRGIQVIQAEGTDTLDETFDLRDLPAGNYTLLIEQNGQFVTRTVIKND